MNQFVMALFNGCKKIMHYHTRLTPFRVSRVSDAMSKACSKIHPVALAGNVWVIWSAQELNVTASAAVFNTCDIWPVKSLTGFYCTVLFKKVLAFNFNSYKLR